MLAKLSAVTASAVALMVVSPAEGVEEQELCFGATPTITGSGAIDGTMGDDVIVGSDGVDQIHTKAGNDKICAGGGDDEIGGGPGSDEIDGGAGNDRIDGGPGADLILGGDGDDAIRCGTENDVVDGGTGTNTASTSGFEACEKVTNASAPQVERTATPHPFAATLSSRKSGAGGRFSATMTATATGATLSWRLTFKGLTGAAQAAHVHEAGSGRVLARLCAPCRSGMSGTAQVSGQPARMALNQGNAYVDVHTKRNLKGEIRGRVVRVGG